MQTNLTSTFSALPLASVIEEAMRLGFEDAGCEFDGIAYDQYSRLLELCTELPLSRVVMFAYVLGATVADQQGRSNLHWCNAFRGRFQCDLAKTTDRNIYKAFNVLRMKLYGRKPKKNG